MGGKEIVEEIAQIQTQFLKTIKNHQDCYGKLQEEGESEEVKTKLRELQQLIRDCETRQKSLVQQLKDGNGNVEYRFNLYNLPREGILAKKRRRKEILVVKPEKKATPVVPSRSPSPAKSVVSSTSSSDDDDDSDGEMSQSSQPVPLPRARSKLLINGHKSFGVSRHDVKYPKMRRRTKVKPLNVTDEELFRDIPVFIDPPPSPPPVDENEVKLKFMAALNLIPTENLPELMKKKTERKRRSTANPHFVYNDEWEYPMKKKVKQYLAPMKNKSPDKPKEEKIDEKETKGKNEKKTVVVGSPKKENEDTISTTKCETCGALATMLECQDCSSSFHPKCSSIPLVEQSFLLCRRCRQQQRQQRGSVDSDDSNMNSHKSQDSSKDSESANEIQERIKMRDRMVNIVQGHIMDKMQLESKVLTLYESMILQDKLKKDLVKDHDETMDKIERLTKFVELFQKTNEKGEVPKEDEIGEKKGLDSVAASPLGDNDGEAEDKSADGESQPPKSPTESTSFPSLVAGQTQKLPEDFVKDENGTERREESQNRESLDEAAEKNFLIEDGVIEEPVTAAIDNKIMEEPPEEHLEKQLEGSSDPTPADHEFPSSLFELEP